MGLTLAVLLLVPLVPGGTGAVPELVVLLEEQGHFHAGLVGLGVGDPVGAALGEAGVGDPNATGPINLARFPFDVHGCHKRLVFDLLYEPARAEAELPDGSAVSLRYEMQVELFAPNGTLLAARRVAGPGYSFPLGTMEVNGTHRVDLYLLVGADVDWWLRIRGFKPIGDEPACQERVVVNEVEANPAGTDAGNEWVELYNPSGVEVDLSGWTLRATHGDPASLTLPAGTSLAPSDRLVVAFTDGQFLDNEDEVLVLLDGAGQERDRTPTLTDTANDDRTHQQVPDGSGAWTFVPSTRGTPN